MDGCARQPARSSGTGCRRSLTFRCFLIRAGTLPLHPGGDVQWAPPLDPARGIYAPRPIRRQAALRPNAKWRQMSPFWSDFIPCAPHASVLTALRHSGRSFTAHVAESAGVPKGFHPLTPRGALCPSTPYFYIISRRVLRLRPQHSAHFYIKHERAFLSTTALIRSVLEYDVSHSKTVSRAAQPNLHSGRLRSLLQVAAR